MTREEIVAQKAQLTVDISEIKTQLRQRPAPSAWRDAAVKALGHKVRQAMQCDVELSALRQAHRQEVDRHRNALLRVAAAADALSRALPDEVEAVDELDTLDEALEALDATIVGWREKTT